MCVYVLKYKTTVPCTQNKQKILCDIVGDGVYDIPKTNI